MNKKESMTGQCESQPPLDLQNKFKLQDLERRFKKLEETTNVLTALCDNYAKRNGIKIEKFKGLVVISQI